MDRPGCSTCGCGDRDEGADFKATLPGVGVDIFVGVVEKRVLVVATPAVEEVGVPLGIDLARVGGCRPMRYAAGADDRNLLRHRIGGAAERFTKRPCSVERRQRRTLTVDVDWDDRLIEVRREEVERHRNAMVELPLFGIRHVDRLHDLGDDPLRKVATARCSKLVDAQPGAVFDWAVVEVGHADSERRHVVHKEVGEVFGRNHDYRLGTRGLDVRSHLIEGRIERVTHGRVGLIGPTGYPRRM